MPFLNPSFLWTFVCFLLTFALISVIGPLAALKTMYSFTKEEPALSKS